MNRQVSFTSNPTSGGVLMMTTTRYLLPGSLVAGTRPIDRLFEQFLGYEAAIREDGTPTYALPLDILETDDAYELHATVAGVPQDSVEVTFESGMLNIAVKAARLRCRAPSFARSDLGATGAASWSYLR